MRLLLVMLLLSSAALARSNDCATRCEDDRKTCEAECLKKVKKGNGATCKTACAAVTEPCRNSCKQAQEKRK